MLVSALSTLQKSCIVSISRVSKDSPQGVTKMKKKEMFDLIESKLDIYNKYSRLICCYVIPTTFPTLQVLKPKPTEAQNPQPESL